MLKNRFLSIFAATALIGLAACEAEEAEVEPVAEETVVTEPVVAEPVVTEPAVAPAPGAAEIPGNGIDDDGDGLIDEAV